MIELQHLTKRFATQGGTVVALNDINLTIRDGDVYGIIGMSGAGKSTLVRCINMLERPDEGNVIVNGKQMQDLRAADLRAARPRDHHDFSAVQPADAAHLSAQYHVPDGAGEGPRRQGRGPRP